MKTQTWSLILSTTLTVILTGCDTIHVTNSAGDVGILVDGQSSSAVNDRGRVGNGTGTVDLDVGALDSASAPNRNEVIAFGQTRSPRRAQTPWTNGDDDFNIGLGSQVSVPVTVWIVQGPFNDQRQHAIEACIRTSAIWSSERTGIRFSAFDIIDATANPNIDNAILNSTGGDGRNWDDFSNDIGFINGRVNIYWINTVEGSTTTGWSDFGGRIVMGRNTGDELLSHELGHAFSLRHPQGCGGSTTNFDQTNVMWPCSNTREFFSEGQIFRAHFNNSSGINNLYNARPGQPTENCVGAVSSAICPERQRRLWDDGAYPAN